MCTNFEKAYIRPFHYFERSYSFSKFIMNFCAIPKKYVMRNKYKDQMQYFCEKNYFYKTHKSSFDNHTYKHKFNVCMEY